MYKISLMKKTTVVVGALLTVVMTSCSSGKGNIADSASVDSLLQDSIRRVEKNPDIEAYPDTSFPSAANVKYKVDTLQPEVSGDLESLRSLYSNAKGVLTFRGGEQRDADFGGRVDTLPTMLVTEWEFRTREDYNPTKHGTWGGGTGWTGQPLYVEWPDSAIGRFKSAGLQFSKEEVMVGSLCGDVYFLDYATGKEVRPAINTGNPIKGTVSLDPTFNGNLYVGQGVPSEKPARAMTINLFANKICQEFGVDPKAQRGWNAYDSSAIRVGQFVFRPGENGTLYKWMVGSGEGEMKLHSAMRYLVGGVAPGMEASMAVSRNYGFTADNSGNVICVNLNSLQPVWHYKLPDDVDATPVLSEEDGRLYLYAGCEVEHAGVSKARFVKLDALTGEEIWINETPARRIDTGEKHFDGGYYSTALPGRGNCSDLLFVNVVHNERGSNGSFLAIEKKSGKVRYSVPLGHYAWSSPVGFLTSKGEQVVVTFDCAGRGYIFNGIDGKEQCRRLIGANFESSPVVKPGSNSLVIGSRGSRIYRLTLR